MRTSLLLARDRAAGARVGGRPEAPEVEGVLDHGDVEGEYRAALEGAAVLDETDRGAVRASGPDAAAFLQRLLASDVARLETGSAHRSLLLTSKGRVEEDFVLLREAEDRFLLSAGPGRGERLAAALERYHFHEELALADATEEHAPLALLGPRAREAAAAALGALGDLEGGRTRVLAFEGGAARVHALRVAGSPGLWLDAGPAGAAALRDALVAAGARPIGLVARERLRVEAGAALAGLDVTPETYPQEVGLEEAFRLDKGCYVGQEVVAKIDTYGGLNRRLVGLRLDATDEVARGTKLVDPADPARDAGVVTSWALSPALGAGLALALVRKRWWSEGTRLACGEEGPAGEILALPVRAVD